MVFTMQSRWKEAQLDFRRAPGPGYGNWLISARHKMAESLNTRFHGSWVE